MEGTIAQDSYGAYTIRDGCGGYSHSMERVVARLNSTGGTERQTSIVLAYTYTCAKPRCEVMWEITCE
jgi:hypothetical protein